MNNNRDTIEYIVWDEFVQAKSWEQYLSDYTGNRMDWRKYFNIITIAFAIAGGATWGVWKTVNAEWVTPVIFGLLGVSQLLSAVQKDIIVSTEGLESLIKLRLMYIQYSDKLEKLYLLIDRGTLSVEEIENKYFDLRKEALPMEELKDSLNISSLKKIDKKVEKRVSDYLTQRYFSNQTN